MQTQAGHAVLRLRGILPDGLSRPSMPRQLKHTPSQRIGLTFFLCNRASNNQANSHKSKPSKQARHWPPEPALHQAFTAVLRVNSSLCLAFTTAHNGQHHTGQHHTLKVGLDQAQRKVCLALRNNGSYPIQTAVCCGPGGRLNMQRSIFLGDCGGHLTCPMFSVIFGP